jgi:flagellar biosynthesis/type III secretory pathway protein FliH
MALIKGNNAKQAAQEAIALDLSDVAKQAEQLKADAQQKADQIIADAEQRAQELTEGADERGYEAGYQRGYEAGHAAGAETGHNEALQQTSEQLHQLQQVWLQAIQQWEQDSQRLQQEARDGVVELALRLARKVVHREVSVDPSVILDQLEHGLSQVMRPLEVTVTIHPDDKPMVEQAMPELVQKFPHVTELHLVTDESLNPGGCQLSYGQGGIDLTLEKQLDRVVSAIQPAPSETVDSDASGQAEGEHEQTESQPATTDEHG